MSTTFTCYEHDDEEGIRRTLEITEQSTRFTIHMGVYATADDEEIAFLETKRLTAEEVVDIAMKLLQPTLYNVSDPPAFMRDVIQKKLSQLFV